MREHMSSSPMNSPPHHEMPFIDADRAPSGRNRHMSGRRHSHARLEEEVHSIMQNLLSFAICRVLCLPYGLLAVSITYYTSTELQFGVARVITSLLQMLNC